MTEYRRPATVLFSSKRYARTDDALARSLIGQVLAELMAAWSDYRDVDGVFMKRDSVRARIDAAQARLDDAPVGGRRGAPFAVPAEFEGLAEESRPNTWIGWMRHMVEWYALAVDTAFVRQRPGLDKAMRALADKHVELVLAHSGANTWHGMRGAVPIGPVMRRRRVGAVQAGAVR